MACLCVKFFAWDLLSFKSVVQVECHLVWVDFWNAQRRVVLLGRSAVWIAVMLTDE